VNVRIDFPYVGCPHCDKHHYLPLESPLGLFNVLESRRTKEWPILLLCSGCGRISKHFEHNTEDFFNDSPFPDVWGIELKCNHKSCGNHKVIYTTCAQSSSEENIKWHLYKDIPQISCSQGHPIVANENTLTALHKYSVP
jgi:hypothetical protein